MTWGDIGAAAVGAAVSWVVFTVFGDALTEAQKAWGHRAKHAVKAVFRRPAGLPLPSLPRDLMLERLTATRPHDTIGKIPFPAGLAPRPSRPPGDGSKALPSVDAVVMTYTTAEAEALADVLTPGVKHTDWLPYTHNWPDYEKQLTSRSPAAFSKCMAHYYLTKVGTHTVLVIKAELHLSTDAKSLPVAQLVTQIANETGCGVFIDTGTAGGVGTSEVLGDVVYSAACKANMADSQFSGEPWAQQRFPATYNWPDKGYTDMAWADLIPTAIGDNLKASGYASRMPRAIYGKDCQTVGYFGFSDTADSYGIVADDANTGVEEMDLVAVTIALEGLGKGAPKWISLRNVSDPEMGGGSLADQKKQAESIYLTYGYFTTVCSALACWGLLADL